MKTEKHMIGEYEVLYDLPLPTEEELNTPRMIEMREYLANSVRIEDDEDVLLNRQKESMKSDRNWFTERER